MLFQLSVLTLKCGNTSLAGQQAGGHQSKISKMLSGLSFAVSFSPAFHSFPPVRTLVHC